MRFAPDKYHTARYVENTVAANKILTLGQHNGNRTGEFKVTSEITATSEELCRKLLYGGEYAMNPNLIYTQIYFPQNYQYYTF